MTETRQVKYGGRAAPRVPSIPPLPAGGPRMHRSIGDSCIPFFGFIESALTPLLSSISISIPGGVSRHRRAAAASLVQCTATASMPRRSMAVWLLRRPIIVSDPRHPPLLHPETLFWPLLPRICFYNRFCKYKRFWIWFTFRNRLSEVGLVRPTSKTQL
jgi:hypothetical protein